jgi:hypothetical protein
MVMMKEVWTSITCTLPTCYTIQSGCHIPTIKNTAQTSYRAAQNFPHISVKKS